MKNNNKSEIDFFEEYAKNSKSIMFSNIEYDESIKKLAEHIKTRVVVIGTDLKHLESIVKYADKNKQFADAFALLYLSLQNTVYIELFKLFDCSGDDSKRHNVYTLIESIEDDHHTYHKMLSAYSKDIDSIKNRRNHLYGHELGKKAEDVYKKNPINHRFEDLLECISKICCIANDKLLPNTYVRNAHDFDDWCYMSLDAIEEASDLHDKVFTIGNTTMERLYEGLDDYLLSLKQKEKEELFKYIKGDNHANNGEEN